MDQTNQIVRNDDIVIDIKEYLWRLLEQWKAVVAFSVIVMLLFSGVMYSRNNTAEMSVETETSAKSQNESISVLTEYEQEMVLDVLNEREACNSMSKYLKESPFMHLDPYNVNVLTATWVIESNRNINKQLVSTYIEELSSDEIADSINLTWNSKYKLNQIKELLFFSSNITQGEDLEYGDGVISMTLYIPEGETTNALFDAVESYVPVITDRLTNSIGSHRITLINAGTQIISDQCLADLQFDVRSRFYNLNNQLFNMINNLSPDQKSALEELYNIDEESEENASSDNDSSPEMTSTISFFNKRYLVAGFILGCFIYSGVYLLFFVFSGRIFSTSSLHLRYGLRILGEWHPIGENSLLSFLIRDRYLNNKRHRGHTDLYSEVKRVDESIINSLDSKENTDVLVISGNKSNNHLKQFVEVLFSTLKEGGICVSETEVNVAEGMTLGERLVSANSAAVVIVDGKSFKHNDIREVCEKCRICNKQLIGAIYID